jgi:hypothetical protein
MNRKNTPAATCLPVLILIGLLLLSAACGGTPTPDIEATVQAAVAATQTAQSAAMPAAEPTNTPMPPADIPMPGAPTHTPVPEPVGDTPTPPSPITGAAGPVACTYYVAPSGSDDTPGIEAQPWATFQQAADTAQPGDTL